MALLLAGGSDGHNALDEAGAVVTLSAEAAFAPEDGRAERALGDVVRRLDAGDAGEGPEGRPGVEQVAAEGANDSGMRRVEPVLERPRARRTLFGVRRSLARSMAAIAAAV